MKRKSDGLSWRYQAVLQKHLKQGPQARLQPARLLGHQAVAAGLDTLELVRIHEQALVTLLAPAYSTHTKSGIIKRAGIFFAEAATPIEETHRGTLEANLRLNQVNHRLRQSTTDLAASNRQLKQEIAQRQVVEEALRRSEQHYGQLLEQPRHLQEQLRHLSHQLLSAQEEERKTISRELHDEIVQTLTGINVRLATLKTEAAVNTGGLQKKITSTQRLVEKSVDIVHRFARELRPTVLDDLGLIPALHSFVKSFAHRTGIRVRLTVFAEIEKLNAAKRTVLYRVAQEALTNVARHAQATRVEVNIQKLRDAVCMEIKDNGKRNHRLGLLGMRERVEMVSGSFSIESAPGQGTTIRAKIPPANGTARKTPLRKSGASKGSCAHETITVSD